MKGKIKRKFAADFKPKAVLEVLEEKDTLAAISKRYELHPNQIAAWKKLFLEQARKVFEKPKLPITTQSETDADLLYEKIDRLHMKLTFLKKVDAISLSQRRTWIDPALETSIRQQCQWLNLPQFSYYYQPCSAPFDDLVLIDDQYLLTP